jgi:hypothetical protein
MNQFDVGTFVIINKCTVKSESGNKVKWIDISYSKSRLGRVTGLCRRWDGIRRHLSNYFSSDDYEPAYLEGTKENILYEIRLGWFNKPIYVRPENMRLAKLNEIKDLPKLFTQQLSWPDYVKKSLSEESKHWPRDKNGRWISESKTIKTN